MCGICEIISMLGSHSSCILAIQFSPQFFTTNDIVSQIGFRIPNLSKLKCLGHCNTEGRPLETGKVLSAKEQTFYSRSKLAAKTRTNVNWNTCYLYKKSTIANLLSNATYSENSKVLLDWIVPVRVKNGIKALTIPVNFASYWTNSRNRILFLSNVMPSGLKLMASYHLFILLNTSSKQEAKTGQI